MVCEVSGPKDIEEDSNRCSIRHAGNHRVPSHNCPATCYRKEVKGHNISRAELNAFMNA